MESNAISEWKSNENAMTSKENTMESNENSMKSCMSFIGFLVIFARHGSYAGGEADHGVRG